MEKKGFLTSHKNSEGRRALPKDLAAIRNVGQLVFEQGYGEAVGHADAEYLAAGAQVAPRSDVLDCGMLVDV